MAAFARKPVENLLAAKSVAIVGASQKGAWPLGIYRNLKGAKFAGGVYLINPNYDELFGDKCYPNLAALPEVPDELLILIPTRAVLGVLEEATKLGTKAATIYTAGFGEGDQALIGHNLESVIADMDRRLAALPHPSPSDRPRAVVLNPNVATVGKGTLVDEIMTRAGLTNVAAELGIDSYGQIPLEAVAANAVDILIVNASRDGPPALATEILRHPVLAALSDRTRVVVMPGRLWNCGGPAVVEAIERLMQVAGEARTEAPAK